MPLDEIPYVDFPELKFDEHESTQMPFRYVKGDDGKPIMPEVGQDVAAGCRAIRMLTPQGMVDLIRADADKAIDDLF